MPVHTHFHQHSVLVPPNPYIHEEIPIWLRVYWKANPTLDHHLKWDLFGLQELECFEVMLNRLFREDMEELVMKYEAMRVTLVQEIEERARDSERFTEIPMHAHAHQLAHSHSHAHAHSAAVEQEGEIVVEEGEEESCFFDAQLAAGGIAAHASPVVCAVAAAESEGSGHGKNLVV